jgi:cytochrome c
MDGFEINKIIASILLAALIAMFAGNIADILYEPDLKPQTKGFVIDVAAAPAEGSAAAEVKFEIGKLMAKADAVAGEQLAKKCLACHVFTKGGANKTGPDLWDVVGSNKARNTTYAYSSAMKDKGGKWDYEDLFHFLHKPKSYISGTKMGFAGFSSPEDIANMVEYMRKQSDSPAAHPPVEGN